MEFITSGEKIKNLRKILGIRQEELTSIGVSRNFISMVENNKRKLSLKTAELLIEIFKSKSKEIGTDLDIDEKYLLKSPQEEAIEYCNEKINDTLYMDEIDNLIDVCNRYSLLDILSTLYVKKGNMLYSRGKCSEAFTYYYDALIFYNSINSIEEKAFIYNKLGKCRLQMLEYFESLNFFTKAYNLSVIGNYKLVERNSLYNMALVYKKLNKIDDALEHINKYIDICDYDIDFFDIIDARVLEANCYFSKNQYNKSIQIYKETLNKKDQLKYPMLGNIYNNLALAYLEVNDCENSLLYFDKSQELREASDKSNLHRTLIDKSNVFIKNKMVDEATNLLTKGFDMSVAYKDLEYTISSFNMLEKIYIDLCDNKRLIYLYEEMLDILSSRENIQSVLLIYIKISNKLALVNIEDNDMEKCKNRLKTLNKLINM
ncbi:helix-turn-helix transcriptional regulator [Clostridium tagluense]|uniref:helix-turn-helix transcriptional regulator n=1 Tax=Clostridium tagluense TaxID=360422 RepID=UPI001CF413A6|nr:helix-turn-helix transcriptional regulator [Clostridium tagluense]MCB2313405.1 helix-turn-helix transcriptional regulator [Clostridium tagluense]MCB2318241.1 helix-turn-helix transcriptional regulator [Clostridium tagluense]MCB2323043.1 helix-turn-helix transcriptional regulator [Clostridium tagluense]MCB2328013.1 helix-turn-helix transcriptional regulator [Clostridium tagluense]MCB2332732.1 helix-turn-helix transcriptional regulator [Clostridium tagluense]